MKRLVVLFALAACAVDDEPDLGSVESEAMLTFEKLATFARGTQPNESTSPQTFAVLGSRAVFFTPRDGLWRTDGTEQGTQLVRDLAPATTTQGFIITPAIGVLNGRGYFFWLRNLWTTDGTPEGTTKVLELEPTADNPSKPIAFNNALYFLTTKGLHRSDGTAAGTVLVVALRSFAHTGSTGFFEHGGRLYFRCDLNGGTGIEPCVTDGTAAGTRVVKNIKAGTATSWPSFIGSIGGKLIFWAEGDKPSFLVPGTALWATDGTEAGTTKLMTTEEGFAGGYGNGRPFAVLGGFAYLPCHTKATGSEICKSDGTAAGTSVLDLTAGQAGTGLAAIVTLGNRLVFTGQVTSIGGRKLWSSDGTVAGTTLLKDIAPTVNDIMYGLRVLGNAVLFSSKSTAQGRPQLWKTDGTVAGTTLLEDVTVSSLGPELGSTLLFVGDDGVHGQELWSTDGITTQLVRDITPPRGRSTINESATVGSSVFFQLVDREGSVMWKTDGTKTGTKVFDTAGGLGLAATTNALFYRGSGGIVRTDGNTRTVLPFDRSIHSPFTAFDNRVAFVATIGTSGSAGLWFSDGTASGTKAMQPSVGGIDRMSVANNALWFNGGSFDNELYTSDGATARRVKDIRSNGHSIPAAFTALDGNTIVFSAFTLEHGRELWKSDGTEAGTVLVKDTRPGSASADPHNMQRVGNRVVFWITTSITPWRRELWATDGTTAGTSLLKALTYDRYPQMTVVWGGFLFFQANDGVSGTELWRTDGTPQGTVRVADLYPGGESAAPESLFLVGTNGPLLFSAEEPKAGRELYILRTPAGTPELAADFAPGPRSSSPRFPARAGNRVLITADDGTGHALYRLANSADDPGDGAELPEDETAGCSTTRAPIAWPIVLLALLLRRRRRH